MVVKVKFKAKTKVNGQGHGESVDGQSEGRDRSSSRATSVVSLLCEDQQDMVELQDMVKLV